MKIEKLSHFSLFEGLSEDEIAHFLFSGNNRPRHYSSEEIIRYFGDTVDGLHILLEGTIKSTMSNEEGKFVTVEIIKAPSLFAPGFVFASDNHFPVNVEACDECEVIVINRERLLELMVQYPQVMMYVLRDISDRQAILSHKLRQFAVNSLKQRILNYIQQFGPITNHSEAAQLLGVARPSLSRALSELAKEGKIMA